MTEHAPMTEERLREIEARHKRQPTDAQVTRNEDGDIAIEYDDPDGKSTAAATMASDDDAHIALAIAWSASRAEVLDLVAALRHERDAGMVECGACVGRGKVLLAREVEDGCDECEATGRVPAVVEVERLRAVVATLTDDAEQEKCDMVRDLERLRVERDALRAIIEGRTTAPTLPEIVAHPGEWLVNGRRVSLYFSDDHDTQLRLHIDGETHSVGSAKAREWIAEQEAECARWIAIDADERPCAWPTPEAPPHA